MRHLFFTIPLSVVLLAGCGSTPEERTHTLKGKVLSVDPDKKTVTVDHEEIPGFMKAMTRAFNVDTRQLVEGIQPGDAIEGTLKVAGSNYVLVNIKKVGDDVATDPEEAAIQANLAKLGDEDRKLAETQRMCPIGCRLGDSSMGVPIKLTIKGQPVFIGCKGCQEFAEKNPDETLNTVLKLKGKK